LPTIINLEDPRSWPADLLAYLEEHLELFIAWESPRQGGDDESFALAKRFDRAGYGLSDVLRPYALVGWHCTKLTEAEIAAITTHGMTPPSAQILDTRIADLERAGILPADIAARLRAKNQASECTRAGRIWFCFFEPHIAGQSGIERFFRSWGGEALYNSHEDDPLTGPVLAGIGTPCLIEAEVPIASLPTPDGLSLKVYRLFLASRGHRLRNTAPEHEDRAIVPLPATTIRRIIRHPELDFVRLTKCNEWRPPFA
jgi:hypothetical protein